MYNLPLIPYLNEVIGMLNSELSDMMFMGYSVQETVDRQPWKTLYITWCTGERAFLQPTVPTYYIIPVLVMIS